MNYNSLIKEKPMSSKDINESKMNYHLSLRKKAFNKILNNRRKIFLEINSLKENSGFISNNDLFQILTNHQILETINKLMNENSLLINNLTEIFQCLFSLDFHINQNSIDSINFIEENKIYIFLILLLEKIFNYSSEKIEYINNDSHIQLINKILQIFFKYSSYKGNNNKMINYLINNNKINIFNQIILSLSNNKNKINQYKLKVNNTKKTYIILYIIIIFYNLSIESSEFYNILIDNKIHEKIIEIINDKRSSIELNDNNLIYILDFFSLNLLDENVKNLDENYIFNIYELLNEKGILSSDENAQELSLQCLCQITSLFESDIFYKKIAYSGIFDNIYQFLKSSNNHYLILVSLKVINNILTEKNIDLNCFIKSSLLKGLMSLIINYEKNKQNMTSDLLHHIISIFLYLTKSPVFYSKVNSNLNFIVILIELIGEISNPVTHDILTFLKDIINESFRISELIIYNNKKLINKLINLIRDDNYNNKIRTISAIILAKILKIHQNRKEKNIDNQTDFNVREFYEQIKEIIEIKLLNEYQINENLKATFKIILEILKEKE